MLFFHFQRKSQTSLMTHRAIQHGELTERLRKALDDEFLDKVDKVK